MARAAPQSQRRARHAALRLRASSRGGETRLPQLLQKGEHLGVRLLLVSASACGRLGASVAEAQPCAGRTADAPRANTASQAARLQHKAARALRGTVSVPSTSNSAITFDELVISLAHAASRHGWRDVDDPLRMRSAAAPDWSAGPVVRAVYRRSGVRGTANLVGKTQPRRHASDITSRAARCVTSSGELWSQAGCTCSGGERGALVVASARGRRARPPATS